MRIMKVILEVFCRLTEHTEKAEDILGEDFNSLIKDLTDL
jgi:hypothetical protein